MTVEGQGGLARRLREMGFVQNQKVTVIRDAPMGGTRQYRLMGYNISLRQKEANIIQVIPFNEVHKKTIPTFPLKAKQRQATPTVTERNQNQSLRIALIGNPNTGKTTIFNVLSGSQERTANYAGATVEVKRKRFTYQNHAIEIVDFPGTYSLTAYGPEEQLVWKQLMDKPPDVIINVLAADNLERNLYLTTQLMEWGLPIVGALNMSDQLKKSQEQLDVEKLSSLLGLPLIPTVGITKKNVNLLLEKAIELSTSPVEFTKEIEYGKEIEEALWQIGNKLSSSHSWKPSYSLRYFALLLLDGDKQAKKLFPETLEMIASEEQKLTTQTGEKASTLIADKRYGFITGALRETLRKKGKDRHKITEELDAIFLNPLLGLPLFFLVLASIFWLTFTIGQYPMDWIDGFFAWLDTSARPLVPEGTIHDWLFDGILSGVGSIIIFLPNILLLLLSIHLLEVSGYLARGTFLMDRVMHKMGLHGHSVIPLLMGFGCNVPAIIATRTLRNPRDRLVTMLVLPFMSCSARLPVYVLIISACLPNYEALALLILYASGIFFAALTAYLLKQTIYRSEDTPFVMELPPYHRPVWKTAFLYVIKEGKLFLAKVGTFLLIASSVVWLLGYFPRQTEENLKELQLHIEQLKNTETNHIKLEQKITKAKQEKASEQLSQSYLGQLGKGLEPIMSPLGFDWRINISLLAGIAAKEVVVSTMGVVFRSSDEGKELSQRLKNARNRQGRKLLSQPTAWAFLFFIALYIPCVTVLSVLKKETGSWLYPVALTLYTTFIAWITAWTAGMIAGWFVK